MVERRDVGELQQGDISRCCCMHGCYGAWSVVLCACL